SQTYLDQDSPSQSLFTKAFIATLDDSKSGALSELTQNTQKQIEQLVGTLRKQEGELKSIRHQTLKWDDPGDKAADAQPAQTPVLPPYSSDEAGGEKAVPQSNWANQLAASRLWAPFKEDDQKMSTGAQPLYDWLLERARQSQQWFEKAQASLPDDPWRDEKYFERLLRNLERLTLESSEQAKLSLAETALAILAALAREGVHSAAVTHAIEQEQLDLTSFEDSLNANPIGQALSRTWKGRPYLTRLAKGLPSEKGQQRHAIGAWFLHATLFRLPAIWAQDDDVEKGLCPLELNQALWGEEQGYRDLLGINLPSLLLDLGKCVGADAQRVLEHAKFEHWPSEASAVSAGHNRIRSSYLAALLVLAGQMALDARRTPESFLQHLGLPDPPETEHLLDTINTCYWEKTHYGRSLRGSCQTPVVDLAIRTMAEHTAHTLAEAHRNGGLGGDWLQTLPARLSCDGLQPAQAPGQAERTYELPHVRFELDQTRIRELLMGESLYGDPELAVRELYQNALDACRYRQARLKYLAAAEGNSKPLEAWQGKIIFRQGVDKERGPYLECIDNGVGMTRRVLRDTFAQAGRRFADMPEFLEEQDQWRRHDIELYPNSQFGIGVLSYFMLADVVEVDTVSMGMGSQPSQRLQVSIPGGGGLFHIEQEDNSGGTVEVGTIVRLYLNQERIEKLEFSCAEKLKELLWWAEFETEVWLDGEKVEVWQAETLNRGPRNRWFSRQDEWTVETAHSQIWWVDDEVSVLVDGIVTDVSVYQRRLFGVLVNLLGPDKPALTADRKQILGDDESALLDWIIERQPWRGPLPRSGTPYKWLARFCRHRLDLVYPVFQEMLSRKQQFSLGDETIPIDSFGCSALDWDIWEYVVDSEYVYDAEEMARLEEKVDNWWSPLVWSRILQYQDFGVELPDELMDLCSEVVESYKLAWTPMLGMLLSDDLNGRGPWRESADVSLAHVVVLSSKLNQRLGKLVDSLESFKQMGFELPVVPEQVASVIPDKRLLMLLSNDFCGDGFWLYSSNIHIGQILGVSYNLNISPSELEGSLQQLRNIGFSVPKVPEQSKVPDGNSTVLLSHWLSGESPWLDAADIPMGHLLSASVDFEQPLGEYSEGLQFLKDMDCSVPEIPEHVKSIIADKKLLVLLSEGLDGEAPWLDATEEIPLDHVLEAVEELDIPLRELKPHLDLLEAMGIPVPDISQHL
ncbi:MAG: hypothetical protein OET90_05975, partial [Desulfuromonadales bacterium]|nr:hypothetical protein [Desulfuromonadales bacterium]